MDKEIKQEFDRVNQRLDYADFDRKNIWQELRDIGAKIDRNRDEIITKIDNFLKLHLKHNDEITAINHRCDRLDSKITALE